MVATQAAIDDRLQSSRVLSIRVFVANRFGRYANAPANSIRGVG